MFKVRLDDGRELTIRFYHSNPYKWNKEKKIFYDERLTRPPEEMFFHGTICEVSFDDIIIKERAFFSPNDKNFDRQKGRKIALTRILRSKGLNLSKKERTDIWNIYLKTIKL